MSTTEIFYERRKMINPIDFADRRTTQRRSQVQTIAQDRRRLSSQVRRHERETFRIPVRLKIQEKEISGYTHNISPEGLMVFSDAPLAVGTPLALKFSFAENVCYLNVSGQVVFCIPSENGGSPTQAVGIKFAAIREFEQKILTSAIGELKQDRVTEEKSLLNIFVFLDTSAQELLNGKSLTINEQEKNTYKIDKTLYLADTCALGTAYFARYFDWQGMAREDFFKRLTPDPLGFFIKSGLKIVTVEAQMEYKHEAILYDEIEIEIKAANLRKASIDLLFFFMNKKTGQLIAQGRQKLAFVNSSGKFSPIPELIRKNVMNYVTQDQLPQSHFHMR